MKVDDKTRKLFDALAMFLQDSLNELKKIKKGDKIKVSLGAIAVLQDSFTIDLVTNKKEFTLMYLSKLYSLLNSLINNGHDFALAKE